MRHAGAAALLAFLVACSPGPRLGASPASTATPVPATPTPDSSPTLPDAIVTLPATPPAPTLRPSDLVTRARADFDCDGRPDDLTLFVQNGPQASANLSWLARLTLATGKSYELAFVAIPAYPIDQQLVGITDVNGDGCADAVIDVGHSASTTWVEFFVFDGSELREVRDMEKPFLFSGSVRHGNGIECRSTGNVNELVTRAVSEATDDYQWDVVERVYQWTGKADLVLASTGTSVIRVPQPNQQPPEMWRYWGLSCGALKTPTWAFGRT